VNEDQLFINILYRLCSFSEAAILWELMRSQADVQEYKTSAVKITYMLDKTIDRRMAQRAFQSLEKRGLIEVRTQKNTATRITLNREAVFSLLDSEPFEPFLPGQGKEHDLPFLRAWNERQQPEPSGAIAVPNETASQPSQPVPN
jgi:hypothetical protein